MPKRSADFDLAAAVASPGFTPRAEDLDRLFELLSGAHSARNAERALGRLGMLAARAAIERFRAAQPPLRSRLCRLVGRVAMEYAEAELDGFLEACLVDPDRKTQRAAIIALGKIGRKLDALLAVWDGGVAIEEQRALAAALGKSGDARALERIERLETSDPELRRIAREARLKLARGASSRAGDHVDLDAVLPEPTEVLLHCRHGLERFVREELADTLESRAVGPGRVAVTLQGSLRTLLESRTALGFGFPLATLPEQRSEAELAAAVSAVIAEERTLRLIRAVTHGTLRFRLEWASAGRRRSLTYRVADDVFRLRPELVNDPRAAAWQIVVEERPRRVTVELLPGRFEDPRFTYRRRLLPAASHPTIAAALARVAGVQADDIVWDPFVGTATELIERARLGPYRSLTGSDSDPRALDAARANLQAAGVRAELVLADARAHRPQPRPTLVLTNPPLGRRLLREAGVAELYVKTLEHIAEVAAATARVVWISPLPDLTEKHARRLGFDLELRQRVDMGGFQAEIQRLYRHGR